MIVQDCHGAMADIDCQPIDLAGLQRLSIDERLSGASSQDAGGQRGAESVGMNIHDLHDKVGVRGVHRYIQVGTQTAGKTQRLGLSRHSIDQHILAVLGSLLGNNSFIPISQLCVSGGLLQLAALKLLSHSPLSIRSFRFSSAALADFLFVTSSNASAIARKKSLVCVPLCRLVPARKIDLIVA